MRGTVVFDTMAAVDQSAMPTNPPGYGSDLTAGAIDGPYSNLLERPVKIASYSWAAGALGPHHLRPWVLFLNNPYVNSVVTRFRSLRGDLMVEIQINATPFHYGLAIAAYEPTWRTSPTMPPSARGYSTCTHSLLDPSTSNVVRMVIPQTTPEAYIDVSNNEAVDQALVSLLSIVDLSSASGTTDACTINVYAYMVNPQLTLPSGITVPFPYVGHSGADEVSIGSTKGFLSVPMASVSRWAGYFQGVPVIGPYAKATSMFASAGADFARFFGFSRPRDQCNPKPMLRTICGDMAQVDAVDNSQSLAVMSDREISIDPRIFGVNSGTDQLSVQAIASRWSLLSTIPWAVGEAADTTLQSYPVEPGFGETVVDGSFFTPTCLWYSAIPFGFWRGTLEVRIQVVASKYHRGRLRFCWVPNTFGGTTLNDSFNHIFDISDRVEHCFQIPYASPHGYLPVRNLDSGAGDEVNGRFFVIVQNELTSPEAVNNAYVLVWVRAGSDFTVAAPDARVGALSRYLPQMGDDDQAKDKECMLHTIIAPSPGTSAQDVYIGDPVLSFRSLMKRYSHVATLPFPLWTAGAQSAYILSWRIPLYPPESGQHDNTPGGWADIGGAGDSNYVTNHVWSYLNNAFLAKRGGFRWKAEVLVPDQFKGSATVTRSSNFISGAAGYPFTLGFKILGVAGGAPCTANLIGEAGIYHDADGSSGSQTLAGTIMGYFNSTAQRLMEFEIPFYEPLKYVTQAYPSSDTQGVLPVSSALLMLRLFNFGASLANPGGCVRVFGAAADDATMGLWRGIPPLVMPAVLPDAVGYSNQITYPTI